MMDFNLCMSSFRVCFGLGSGSSRAVVRDPLVPTVVLDTCNMGNDVVIVKNGHRICGTGAALASAPIVQNKAYFEVKIQQTGLWGVGLANGNCNLNKVPLGADTDSWILRCDGKIYHNNEKLYELPSSISMQEGDIIGVTYDHSELNFRVNNAPIDFSILSIRGSNIFPVIYVDDGAIIDASFTTFQFEPPLGYDRIIVEKSLL
ncbi:SPRY domain-containing protein 7 [Halotydeus destructor]|nr:SPRY domain-containing protein 7 [Halotydeus destructor]